MTDLPRRHSSLPTESDAGPDAFSDHLGRHILGAEPGRVHLVAGIGAAEARACVDPLVVPENEPIALVLPLERVTPADAVIEDLARHLACVAAQCWPIWYGDVDFSGIKRDTLGREIVRLKLAAAAGTWPRLAQAWARAAIALLQERRAPRPARVHWSIEIIQLCLAIHPSGLVIVLDAGCLPEPTAARALVHALELLAGKASLAIVVLCVALPPPVPPYDRILIDSVSVPPPRLAQPAEFEDLADVDLSASALVPISGRPHPLSEVEKRVAKAIEADAGLAPLFRFNQVIETVRGSRPKVDLLWGEGRLVVELDGYSDHSRRDIFLADRHRDYELTLSGYTVLRLANDEVHQDVEKAIDKIRDIVEFLSPRIKRSA